MINPIPATNGASNFQRVCYVIAYNGNLNVPMIEPKQMQWNLCTHVIYGFGNVFNGTLNVNSTMVDYIQRMNSTKIGTVKTMISIGGSEFNFVKKSSDISRFIDSIITFVTKYNLDGIDIDWEFPYLTNDKKNFSKLLKMIRSRFDHMEQNLHRKLLLSVAITPIMYIADKSYQISIISKYVSFVNLMTYDYHVPNTFPYTNYNSPLYSSQYDLLYFKYFNVYFSAHYMHYRGLRREQIIIGIPFYGYMYYLADPRFHSVYSLHNGTQVSINYNEICSNMNTSKATRVFDRITKVPYLYEGIRWISYDDEESITIKSQWIVDNGYGGAMSFALNYDLFKNDSDSYLCSQKQLFPLQSTINDILNDVN